MDCDRNQVMDLIRRKQTREEVCQKLLKELFNSHCGYCMGLV